MASSDAHLLTLINLLDGRLSAVEGAAVRERLAADISLRRHWHTLANAVGTRSPLAGAEENIEVDIETAAAFVDGELSDDEAATVERLLWENHAALREVVAAYRSVQTDPVDEKIAIDSSRLRQCLKEVVESEIGVTATEAFDEKPTIHSTAMRRPVNGSRPMSAGTQPDRLSPIPARGDNNVRSHRSLKERIGPGGIVAAVAALVLGVGVVIFFAVRGGGRLDDGPIAAQPAPQNGSPPTSDTGENGVEFPSRVQPNSPDVPKVVDGPGRDVPIVKTPPRLKPPSPVPPKKIPVTPEGAGRGEIVQVVWTDVIGVAAKRWGDMRRWSGLLSRNGRKVVDGALAVRTLPHGWVRGEVTGGLQVVIGANSEIQLTVWQRKSATQLRTTIDLRIPRGRAAITGLRAGETVRLHDAEHEWTVRSQAEETRFGLIRLDGLRREFVVWDGAVQVDDLTLAAGQSVTWNGRIFEQPVAIASLPTWRQRPESTLGLRPSVVDAINRSDNVLLALTAQNRGARKQDIRLAANLAFALDAANAVPSAALSNIETRRLAAVRWLLVAKDEQPEKDVVWRKIEASLGSVRPKLAVRAWFRAAQSKTRPKQQHLAELSAGLSAHQPLFVRQSAIHFLRKITGKRLAVYDPNRPTKKTIDVVRQQLRRATNNGRGRKR